jgi:putative tricarboxylic transport membrane protein
VLGGFAETYLNLSTSIFGAEWLTRPGVLVLGAVVVASLTYGVIISRRSKKQPTPQQLLETK